MAVRPLAPPRRLSWSLYTGLEPQSEHSWQAARVADGSCPPSLSEKQANYAPNAKKVAERPKEAAPRLASEAVLSNEKRAPYRPPFTLAIIGLNVLVFAAMAATGVPIVKPNSSHLLKWGADYGPYALGGQPWIILTSNYVHIGIVHLAVNMWSLWMVGRLSERIFGGWGCIDRLHRIGNCREPRQFALSSNRR